MSSPSDDHERELVALAESVFAQQFPTITATTVAREIGSLAKQLKAGRDLDWLAGAIRLSLMYAASGHGDAEVGFADVRNRLEGLASDTQQLLTKLKDLGRGEALVLGLRMVTAPEVDGSGPPRTNGMRILRAIDELQWLHDALLEGTKKAAAAVELQHGNWTGSVTRTQRRRLAVALWRVFENGFVGQPTINNARSDHESKTPFMRLFQASMKLGFGEVVTPDLPGLLAEAKASSIAAKSGNSEPPFTLEFPKLT